VGCYLILTQQDLVQALTETLGAARAQAFLQELRSQGLYTHLLRDSFNVTNHQVAMVASHYQAELCQREDARIEEPQAYSPSLAGGVYRDGGDYVEQLITPYLEDLLGTHADASFEKGLHGLDARHTADDGGAVAIEIKSVWGNDKSAGSQLGRTVDHGKEMSEEWLAHHGEHPADTHRVIVQVNMVTETVHAYLMDADRGTSERQASYPLRDIVKDWPS
jgi:hypothetical protein